MKEGEGFYRKRKETELAFIRYKMKEGEVFYRKRKGYNFNMKILDPKLFTIVIFRSNGSIYDPYVYVVLFCLFILFQLNKYTQKHKQVKCIQKCLI